MNSKSKKIIYFFIFIVTIIFLIFITNQIFSIYANLDNIRPIYGKIFIYTLGSILLIFLTLIIFQFSKFSKQITLPKEEDSKEYNKSINALVKILKNNNHIENDIDYNEQNKTEWVLECLNQLDTKTNNIIEENAQYVFLSTAISQNGIFDSIIVLIAQIKMIWQILHIYYQRPNLKSIISLYTNVVITIFTVKAIEDFEFVEKQIEPIVASILGSSVTPGFNVTALLLVNSLISGTANAFLTLRIGLITQKYSSPVITEEKRKIKKNANIEASKMLGKVISGSIVLLTKSIGKASINATKRFGEGSKNKAKEFTNQTKEVTKNIIDSIKNKIS